MPSVFISYSHDPADPAHAERVAGLAASLLQDGLKVFLDANRGPEEEKVPWPIWMTVRAFFEAHLALTDTVPAFNPSSTVQKVKTLGLNDL
jgi:hypothetical protein